MFFIAIFKDLLKKVFVETVNHLHQKVNITFSLTKPKNSDILKTEEEQVREENGLCLF